MSEFPWIKSYPVGMRYDRELVRKPVWQILDDAVAAWPNNPALDFMGKKLTYRELGAEVDRAASAFRALGVKPGVHVGLYLPNTPHYIICFFGVLKAGGTVVNYSPLDVERILAHKIDDSETDIMVTLDVAALYPAMSRLIETTRLSTLVVGNIAEMSGHPEAVAAQMKAAGHLAEVNWGPSQLSFADFMGRAGRGTEPPAAISDLENTVAVLQYTGGTTGQPKAAMLTHANLSVACAQYWEGKNAEPKVLEEGRERMLAALPLFHIYALTVNMLFGIRLGAELVLLLRFEVEAALREISSKKISIFPAVPTMFAAVIHNVDASKYDVSSLRFCGCGGAPLPPTLQEKFEQVAGCRVLEGWGMTETSPTGTFTPRGARPRPGSCGLPLPGIVLEFRSLEDPEKRVPLGERGEICIRGPNVMKGYWKNPEATAAATTSDGFFRTGDVGYMDEDGYVYIVDRTKDMILCGGFNVYPRNIEEAIYEHPSVAEVTVIGISCEYRGQRPKAFIKLKPGAKEFTLEELKEFLKTRLGKHEMVQALAFRAELPRTPVGKLSKKELYEEEERARQTR